MTSQEKKNMGFDVKDIVEINRNKVDRIESKAIQNPYAEAYMKDKKRVVLKDGVTDIVRNIKRKRNFNSDNETIKFLCDLENELTKKQMLKEFAKCPDCGVSMSIDHVKKIHRHVDKNVECYGCLERGHKIESGTNEEKVVESAKDKKRLKDEQSGQTDTKDEQIDEIKEIDEDADFDPKLMSRHTWEILKKHNKEYDEEQRRIKGP